MHLWEFVCNKFIEHEIYEKVFLTFFKKSLQNFLYKKFLMFEKFLTPKIFGQWILILQLW